MSYDLNDIGDFDPNAARKALEKGGLVPVNKYHARLESAKEQTAGNTSFQELVFTILAGPYAGYEVRAKLWDSDKPANRQRDLLFRSSLKMIARSNGKWAVVGDKHTYQDALGSTCVIEVEHESYTKKDTQKTQTNAVVSFNGIWAETDPEVARVEKAKHESIQAAKPVVDKSDL